MRVSYSDINNTRLLVEIAFARDGYTPEVSYGTHFFADLVEADIAIMPLYPDTKGSSLNEDLLLGSATPLRTWTRALPRLSDVIRVIHVPPVLGGNAPPRVPGRGDPEGDRDVRDRRQAPLRQVGDPAIPIGEKTFAFRPFIR